MSDIKVDDFPMVYKGLPPILGTEFIYRDMFTCKLNDYDCIWVYKGYQNYKSYVLFGFISEDYGKSWEYIRKKVATRKTCKAMLQKMFDEVIEE